MYVLFNCKECGEEVNSNMEHCSTCGAALPEFQLERDYDSEIAEEMYKLRHPIRYKILNFIESYANHIVEVAEQEEELERPVTEKGEKIKAEKGRWHYRWFRYKRILMMSLAAIIFFALWVFPISILFNDTEDSPRVWLLFFLASIIPLYFVSLYLLVSRDKREIPLSKKITQSLLGAFNKLVFSIIFIGLFSFVWINLINLLPW
jgi:hypothetical protein